MSQRGYLRNASALPQSSVAITQIEQDVLDGLSTKLEELGLDGAVSEAIGALYVAQTLPTTDQILAALSSEQPSS